MREICVCFIGTRKKRKPFHYLSLSLFLAPSISVFILQSFIIYFHSCLLKDRFAFKLSLSQYTTDPDIHLPSTLITILSSPVFSDNFIVNFSAAPAFLGGVKSVIQCLGTMLLDWKSLVISVKFAEYRISYFVAVGKK